MKTSQRISSATDTDAFQRVSSAADEKTDQDKTCKVKKGAYYGTREEWVTDKKNDEEGTVDFEIEYGTRHKSQQKDRASNRIMK